MLTGCASPTNGMRAPFFYFLHPDKKRPPSDSERRPEGPVPLLARASRERLHPAPFSTKKFYFLSHSLPDIPNYHRTLYYSPNLPLNKNGQATITLYNIAKETLTVVSTESFGAGSKLLCGSNHPEEQNF